MNQTGDVVLSNMRPITVVGSGCDDDGNEFDGVEFVGREIAMETSLDLGAFVSQREHVLYSAAGGKFVWTLQGFFVCVVPSAEHIIQRGAYGAPEWLHWVFANAACEAAGMRPEEVRALIGEKPLKEARIVHVE